MNYDTALRIIADAGISMEPGVSNEKIKAAEARLNFHLHSPLREFLRVCGGFVFTYGTFLGASGSKLDIEQIVSLYPEWPRRGFQPIADDGCGNYFVMVRQVTAWTGFPIGFVDVSEDATQLAYAVASNLTSFVKGYIEKRDPEDNWPFDQDWVIENDPDLVHVEVAPLPWDA